MSYTFAGTQHWLAQFASSIDLSSSGLTIACWSKGMTSGGNDGILALGNNPANLYDYAAIRTTAVAGDYVARCRNQTNTTNGTATANTGSVDWIPLIATFSAENNRDIYANNVTANNTTSIDTSTLSYLRVGADIDGSARVSGSLAEIAIWNTVLSGAEIDSYEAGNAASGIAAANLIGYWAFNVDDTTPTNAGVGSMTSDLVVSLGTPTYNADHPTITSGGPHKLVGKFGGKLRGKI